MKKMILCFIGLMVISIVFAQYVWEQPVCAQRATDFSFSKVIATEEGAVVAYSTLNSQRNYDIYIQRINTQTGELTDSAVCVISGEENQKISSLVKTSDNNYMVCWLESTPAVGYNSQPLSQVYVQKFDTDFQPLWPTKIQVSEGTLAYDRDKMLLQADAAGGVFLSSYTGGYWVAHIHADGQIKICPTGNNILSMQGSVNNSNLYVMASIYTENYHIVHMQISSMSDDQSSIYNTADVLLHVDYVDYHIGLLEKSNFYFILGESRSLHYATLCKCNQQGIVIDTVKFASTNIHAVASFGNDLLVIYNENHTLYCQKYNINLQSMWETPVVLSSFDNIMDYSSIDCLPVAGGVYITINEKQLLPDNKPTTFVSTWKVSYDRSSALINSMLIAPYPENPEIVNSSFMDGGNYISFSNIRLSVADRLSVRDQLYCRICDVANHIVRPSMLYNDAVVSTPQLFSLSTDNKNNLYWLYRDGQNAFVASNRIDTNGELQFDAPHIIEAPMLQNLYEICYLLPFQDKLMIKSKNGTDSYPCTVPHCYLIDLINPQTNEYIDEYITGIDQYSSMVDVSATTDYGWVAVNFETHVELRRFVQNGFDQQILLSIIAQNSHYRTIYKNFIICYSTETGTLSLIKFNDSGTLMTGWPLLGVPLPHFDANYNIYELSDQKLLLLDTHFGYAEVIDAENGQNLWSGVLSIPQNAEKKIIVDGTSTYITYLGENNENELTCSRYDWANNELTLAWTQQVQIQHVIDDFVTQLVGNKILIAYQTNDSETNPSKIYLRVIKTNGKLDNNTNGLLLSEQQGSQFNPVISSAGDDFAYVSWVLNCNFGAAEVYCQKVNLDALTATQDPNQVVPTLALNQNYPNPFNPTTTIAFTSSISQPVNLAIYNIKGERICTLLNGKANAGENKLVWSGKNDKNLPVSSGIYFYKLQIGDKTITRKMILLK